MKKLLATVTLSALLVLGAAAPARAATTEEIRIQLLEQLVVLLTQQLNLLKEQLNVQAEINERSGIPRERNVTGGTPVAIPQQPTRDVATKVVCERAYLSGSSTWITRQTEWRVGQVRSNSNYSSVDQCRVVEYYEDGSGIISESPIY